MLVKTNKNQIQYQEYLIEDQLVLLKQIKRLSMQVSSPFIQYIPDCKKKMRKLRKKIYKYTTSKTYAKLAKNNQNSIVSILQQRQIPSFLMDALIKKRTTDLGSLKNIIPPQNISLQHIRQLVRNQELQVEQKQQQHKEYLKAQKIRLQELQFKEPFSRRTIESTEQLQFENEVDEDIKYAFHDSFAIQYQSMSDSFSNKGIENHFLIRNDFFEMESSVFSQQNLFKN